MLAWLLSLLRRSARRSDAPPLREDEAYARSYGDRSGEIVRVAAVERKPIPRRTGDLSGELLRCAFEAKLDARGKASTT